ncbi:MAG: hypothetical protein AB7P23_05585 [Amphiplicatus sp.]
MNRSEAVERLHALNNAISLAQSLIRNEKETLDQFFTEKERMESVGALSNPTLFKDPERQAVEAMLTPVYEAARVFLRDYDRAMDRAKSALEKVKEAS